MKHVFDINILYLLNFIFFYRKKESQTLSICEGKWVRVIDAFSTLFLSEGPGYERESFLSIKAGASGRIARYDDNFFHNSRGMQKKKNIKMMRFQ